MKAWNRISIPTPSAGFGEAYSCGLVNWSAGASRADASISMNPLAPIFLPQRFLPLLGCGNPRSTRQPCPFFTRPRGGTIH